MEMTPEDQKRKLREVRQMRKKENSKLAKESNANPSTTQFLANQTTRVEKK